MDDGGRGSLSVCFDGWLYSGDKGSGGSRLKGWICGCVVGRRDGSVDAYDMGVLGSCPDS